MFKKMKNLRMKLDNIFLLVEILMYHISTLFQDSK